MDEHDQNSGLFHTLDRIIQETSSITSTSSNRRPLLAHHQRRRREARAQRFTPHQRRPSRVHPRSATSPTGSSSGHIISDQVISARHDQRSINVMESPTPVDDSPIALSGGKTSSSTASSSQNAVCYTSFIPSDHITEHCVDSSRDCSEPIWRTSE
jgi:hypothetical protein